MKDMNQKEKPVTLTPVEVKEKFGINFCRGFFTMVDRERMRVRIIEKCIARGPVEWDHANRIRAGGALISAWVEGNMLIMDAKIGVHRDVRFGPASDNVGGQALTGVEIRGREVLTTWKGIAGASMGIGACIPGSSDVLRTDYKNLKIGGANETEVTIYTKEMVRLIVGIDDTDTPKRGASWVLALKLAENIPVGNYICHKIIQLYPGVPEKTTNCVSIGLSFAVPREKVSELKKFIINYVKERTYSNETTIVFYTGLDIERRLKKYGFQAKRKILSIQYAKRTARESNVEVVNITGEQGLIGALAGIGCFEDRDAAKLYSEKSKKITNNNSDLITHPNL